MAAKFYKKSEDAFPLLDGGLYIELPNGDLMGLHSGMYYLKGKGFAGDEARFTEIKNVEIIYDAPPPPPPKPERVIVKL